MTIEEKAEILDELEKKLEDWHRHDLLEENPTEYDKGMTDGFGCVLNLIDYLKCRRKWK